MCGICTWNCEDKVILACSHVGRIPNEFLRLQEVYTTSDIIKCIKQITIKKSISSPPFIRIANYLVNPEKVGDLNRLVREVEIIAHKQEQMRARQIKAQEQAQEQARKRAVQKQEQATLLQEQARKRAAQEQEQALAFLQEQARAREQKQALVRTSTKSLSQEQSPAKAKKQAHARARVQSLARERMKMMGITTEDPHKAMLAFRLITDQILSERACQ